MQEEPPAERTEALPPVPELPIHTQHYNRLEQLKNKHEITWRQVGEIIGLSVSSIMNLKTGGRHALIGDYMARLVEAEKLGHIEKTSPPSRLPKDTLSPDARFAPQPGPVPPAPQPEPEPEKPKKAKVVKKPQAEAEEKSEAEVAHEALDLMAEVYRNDVAFVMSILTREQKLRFVTAVRHAAGSAVDDLRRQEGLEELVPVFTGAAGRVVKKMTGRA